MSTLWTPSGEHHVPKKPAQPQQAPAESSAGGAPAANQPASALAADDIAAQAAAMGVDLDSLSPEERQQVEAAIAEMVASRARLASTPAADVIANHAMGLYELAAIHLSAEQPNFNDAALAIDALRALSTQLGDRLGEATPVIGEALSQLQMAFVNLTAQHRAAGGDTGAAGDETAPAT